MMGFVADDPSRTWAIDRGNIQGEGNFHSRKWLTRVLFGYDRDVRRTSLVERTDWHVGQGRCVVPLTLDRGCGRIVRNT